MGFQTGQWPCVPPFPWAFLLFLPVNGLPLFHFLSMDSACLAALSSRHFQASLL